MEVFLIIENKPREVILKMWLCGEVVVPVVFLMGKNPTLLSQRLSFEGKKKVDRQIRLDPFLRQYS